MPAHHVTSTLDPDISLYVEDSGHGVPILFIHEFAGDHRSWEAQVRFFSDRYRCITYSARGYPPSSVPARPEAYSQQHAVRDAIDVLDALSIDRVHLVGLSMGGFCALHVGLTAPERVLSLAVAGVGYGAEADKREDWKQECNELARAFEASGSAWVAARYAMGPARVQLKKKDPIAHRRFIQMMSEHPSNGSALTLRGVQKERPSLFEMSDEFSSMELPFVVMVGDDDKAAVDASVMLKHVVPGAGLVVFPRSGHTLNLEEPRLFNIVLETFLNRVTNGTWTPKSEPVETDSVMGVVADSTSD